MVMASLKYIRQSDGTFKKEGYVKTRKVRMRIFRAGEWKEGICDHNRVRIMSILEDKENLKYLPADIYELVEVESELTPEESEKLKNLKRRNDD